MRKLLATLVAAAVALAFAGIVSAEEQFPKQEATVTTTVTTPDGKVVKEDVVTDTTKGADTTTQFKELQKEKTDKEMKAAEEKKPAAPAKKKTSKKKSKKAKAKTEAAPAAATPAPEAPAAK